MCDEQTEQDNEAYLSRRGFTAALAAAALLPRGAWGAELEARDVAIPTPDGTVDARFVHPRGTASAAVLIWPDILGRRPAFHDMAQRLASEGYAVLVVNPYYRVRKAPVVAEGASFRDPDVRKTVMALAEPLSADTTRRDARALIDWLDAQEAVDTTRGIGTAGYCMGGPMVLWTAAHVPERVRAAATFHGGGLVTQAPDSPHLGIPTLQGEALIAIAANDDERDPAAKDALRKAFAEAKVPAEIEVYAGAMHGWCPPDSSVYDEALAEKAWARQLALYARSLA